MAQAENHQRLENVASDTHTHTHDRKARKDKRTAPMEHFISPWNTRTEQNSNVSQFFVAAYAYSVRSFIH